MVNTISLALVASAVLSASAVQINFRRFSRDQCEDAYHIRKDTNLHDPHCKTFSDNEPPFSSFILTGDDDMDDTDKKHCYATVFDQKDCKGEAAIFNHMENYKDTCAPLSFDARSVRISCDAKDTGYDIPMVSWESVVQTPEAAPVTNTYAVAEPTTPATNVYKVATPDSTVMLVPEQTHDNIEPVWCTVGDGNGAVKKVRRGVNCL